jgi:hypothetical protein
MLPLHRRFSQTDVNSAFKTDSEHGSDILVESIVMGPPGGDSNMRTPSLSPCGIKVSFLKSDVTRSYIQ